MKKGFTIIETLVAIAILMIAITGPLVAASDGLRAAAFAHDQTMASYLAQEEIELIRNMKDNSQIATITGLSCTNTNPNSTNSCGIYVSDVTGTISAAKCSNLNGCQLYAQPIGYSYVSGSSVTSFTRYFFVESMNVSTSELRITAVVSWNEGNIPSEVRIIDEMAQSSL